ncbi:MAG: transporter [Acidobacteriota bacterium]|nr:transporter [Acidobacteriota bacterium]
MRANAIGVATVLATALWTASFASAQQRPLVTEDPETIGSGRILVEAGLDVEQDAKFPLSGLSGDLFAFPTLGVSIGLSSIAELQIDGGLYQRLSIKERVDAPLSSLLPFTGDETSSVKDLVIATKIRMLSEGPGRPALGIRFATRLPNASNGSGLGRDTTDFTAQFLVGKTIQSIRVVGNIGMLIQEDPAEAARQDDLLVFGLSLARALAEGFEVVGEVSGRANFGQTIVVGAEDGGVFRAGARYTRGPVRVDGGLLIGLGSRDPDLGFTTGLTWVFNAFTVP